MHASDFVEMRASIPDSSNVEDMGNASDASISGDFRLFCRAETCGGGAYGEDRKDRYAAYEHKSRGLKPKRAHCQWSSMCAIAKGLQRNAMCCRYGLVFSMCGACRSSSAYIYS